MNRSYPGIIIDRSRRSSYAKQIYDFIVCTDDSAGFIARACKVNKIQFEAYNQQILSLNKEESECKYIVNKINNNFAIVIEVLKILNPPLTDRSRIKSLLKKVMKQYVESEIDIINGDGSNIDQQIAAVDEMKRLAESQYDNLVLNNSKEIADHIIKQLKNASTSLSFEINTKYSN